MTTNRTDDAPRVWGRNIRDLPLLIAVAFREARDSDERARSLGTLVSAYWDFHGRADAMHAERAIDFTRTCDDIESRLGSSGRAFRQEVRPNRTMFDWSEAGLVPNMPHLGALTTRAPR
jgi:hypothetical protein